MRLGFAYKAGAIIATALHCVPFLHALPTEKLKQKNLVVWYGSGGIQLPSDPAWNFESLTTYNNGARPVAQFRNKATQVIASFIIFENLSGTPTSEGCRKDVLSAILKNEANLISGATDGEMDDGHGGTFATASHFTRLTDASRNHDRFAFSGNAKTCTEIHVSTVSGQPDEDKRLQDALAQFAPVLVYQAAWIDYFGVATNLYEESPLKAAPYFDAALKAMPSDSKEPEIVTARRLSTDVVIVALERMGNLKASRGYAENAVKSYPEYPMSYYHLACLDAAQGHAKDAKLHLQQAFDRKANLVAGEHMPDPMKDESISKLRKDKEFWAFVQTLK